jgi:hypothetical protein
MTRRASGLLPILIPAVLLLCGTAVAMPLGAPDKLVDHKVPGFPLLLLAKEVVIHNGCPAGLDKICQRIRGRLRHCRCAS